MSIEEEFRTQFKRKFMELRRDRGINETQEKFAKFLGLSRPTIGFYEEGKRIPDAFTLKMISEKCNVSADWLLGAGPKNTDIEIQAIYKKIGLSEESINILEEAWEKKETRYLFTHTINELIKDRILIRLISEYLFTEMEESHKFDLCTIEKDYDTDGTITLSKYEFNEEKRKNILLLEIQNHLRDMLKESEVNG